MAITSFTRNAPTAAHADLSWCGAAVPNTPTGRARNARARNARARNARARNARARNARARNARARNARARNARARNARARNARARNARARNARARIVYNMHGPDISVIGLNAFSQSWDQTIPALQTACPSIIRARI